MFVPPIYSESDPDRIWLVIQAHPLALLVSNGPDAPYATHLPMIPHDVAPSGLVGSVLWGHLNRANPHWAAITRNTKAKAVFTGPNSYISPVDYHAPAAAPTWDFVSVHLTGEVTELAAGEESLRVVRRTAELLEARFGQGWDQTGSLDYFRSIVSGVGAFTFRVVAAEAMFKLSQEKDEAVQERVVDRLRDAEAGCPAGELGRLMAAHRLAATSGSTPNGEP